jgi:AcrR family transcriptional regulator
MVYIEPKLYIWKKIMAAKNKARVPAQKRGIETRDKILEAAWVLFGEKGYFKTNPRDIAQHAGVATGSFYAYFNNKKEVAIELIRRFYKEAIEKALSNINLEIGDTIGDNLDSIRMLIRFVIKSLKESHAINPLLHKEASALILLDEEVNKINNEEQKKVISFLIALFQQYKKYIRVNDLEAAASLLFKTSDEIIHRIMFNEEEIDEERLLRELEDMICSYLFISG